MSRKAGRPIYRYLVEYDSSIDHGPWEPAQLEVQSSDPVLALRRITNQVRSTLIASFRTTDVRVRSVQVRLPEPVCPDRSRSKA